MKRGLQPASASAQQPESHGNRPDLLSQVEVCRRFGISDETWMRWRKAGRTPDAVTLPSGRLKWRAADIDRLVAAPVVPARRRYFGHKAQSGPRLVGSQR